MTLGTVHWEHELALEYERCLLAAELQRRSFGHSSVPMRERALRHGAFDISLFAGREAHESRDSSDGGSLPDMAA